MMVHLAKQPPGTTVSLRQIARDTGISRRYLEQLALALKNAGLVLGHAGRQGGYELGSPPSEIPLCQIIEACIGPINIVDCVSQPRTCLKVDVCECRPVYTIINRRIREVFRTIALADMLEPDGLEDLLEPSSENPPHGDPTDCMPKAIEP